MIGCAGRKASPLALRPAQANKKFGEGRASAVAKDSDKRRVLTRRKQELDHAIANGYPAEALHVRAE